ncbi:hypothetical protein [Chitinophaga solisilvae]|uniref:hypothetical protein n=1 Tax=Chitinophaga solisilvae TaxID=1233460 RepID=UPI00136A4F7B|nr:hypothetical protein [Chitinophaga solisilvae]
MLTRISISLALAAGLCLPGNQRHIQDNSLPAVKANTLAARPLFVCQYYFTNGCLFGVYGKFTYIKNPDPTRTFTVTIRQEDYKGATLINTTYYDIVLAPGSLYPLGCSHDAGTLLNHGFFMTGEVQS